MGAQLKIEIAQICSSIVCDDDNLVDLLKHRYQGFFSQNDPIVSIEVGTKDSPKSKNDPPLGVRSPEARITSKDNRIAIEGIDFKGVFDTKRGKAYIYQPLFIHPFDWFLRLIYSYYLVQVGGFFLHSAAIVKQDKGYVFFGPSGSGKSTIAALSPESCLCDELVIIKRTEGSYCVFGTPFWNGKNKSVPLRGLYELRKGQQVSLTRFHPVEATTALLSNMEFGLQTPQMTKELFLATSDLVETVPCYSMHSLPDNSFWPCIEEAM